MDHEEIFGECVKKFEAIDEKVDSVKGEIVKIDARLARFAELMGDFKESAEIARFNRDQLVEIKTSIMGVKHTSDKGLTGSVQLAHQRIEKTNEKVNRLWIVVAALGGSGVLTAAAYAGLEWA